MKSSKELNEQIFGKLPPQALDIEEAVLGAIMLEKGAIDEVIATLPHDAFYKDAHQEIYKACRALYGRSEPIDILTVVHELRRNSKLEDVGGGYYISTLTNRVASASNIKNHSRIILQTYAQREIIRICSDATKDSFEGTVDVFDLVDRVDNEIQTVRETLLGKSETMEWIVQVNETVQTIENLYNSPIKVSGVTTGNPKLDAITGGWQKTDLIILAGRPGSGKSTRAINLIKHACLKGLKVCMFSLEMGWPQIARKFINEETEVYIQKLVTGDISKAELNRIIESKQALAKMNFYLNDKAAISPGYIRTILKQRQKKHGVDMVIVDYTQIMSPNEKLKGRSRDSELGTISGGLKNLAKEFNVPVITLCQLSRKCEERIDKRPILSDLRESGSLENDADLVIGLYRPSYYYEFSKDRDYKSEYDSGQMVEDDYKKISELLILKHRNGESDRRIKENFFGEYSRFTPRESDQQNRNNFHPNPNTFTESIKQSELNPNDETPF